VAAKTGTSKNFRDNWCVGATPELTVAVWAGNFSGRPMGQVSGVTGAGPIWRQVLQAAMEGRSRTPLAERAGLVSAAVCPLSGDRPGVDCPTSIQELFAPGKLPEWSCQMHVSVRITADGMSRANPDCPAPGESIQTFEVYPPRFEEWAQRSGRPLAPRGQAGCAGRVGAERRPSDESAAQRTRETSQAEQRLRIQSPVPGGQYAYDPGIPQAFQKLRMRVASPKGRKLQWRLNGLPLAEGVTSLDWPVRRGRWTLEVQTADDGTPLSAAAEFLVK
jgi:penicillin-binding protein 1C